MAKKKNVTPPEPQPEEVTPEFVELTKRIEAMDKANADAIAAAKAEQDARDAAVVKPDPVTVACEVCGKVLSASAGADPNPAKVLKESGTLPLLGTCKGAPAKCLVELARAL